jgi:CBS domain-containing protein
VNATELMAAATAAPVQLTVRQVLAAWGFRARTFENVDRITQDLSRAGLSCRPDLRGGNLDTLVQVGLHADANENVTDEAAEDEPLQLPSVAPLIWDITSATAGVTSVSPNETLAHARGLMIEREFSQLPVMDSERDLIGYVSWRTIAEKQLSTRMLTLADVTKPVPHVVRDKDTLLEQVHHIYETDFVLVRDGDGRICGIVTCADLSAQFYDLTTPYFEVGEIENRLRICVDRVFSPEELRQVTGNARVKSAEDLTFYQYIQLLRDAARWQRMGWDGIDQTRFIQCLDDARKVRNATMHFGKELTPEDRERLKQCLRYMRALLTIP